jgi:hypothetical protein
MKCPVICNFYNSLHFSSTRYTLKPCSVTTETLTEQALQKIRHTRYTRYTILAATHPLFFRGEYTIDKLVLDRTLKIIILTS